MPRCQEVPFSKSNPWPRRQAKVSSGVGCICYSIFLLAQYSEYMLSSSTCDLFQFKTSVSTIKNLIFKSLSRLSSIAVCLSSYSAYTITSVVTYSLASCCHTLIIMCNRVQFVDLHAIRCDNKSYTRCLLSKTRSRFCSG